MKTINKILTVLALAAAFVLPASAAEEEPIYSMPYVSMGYDITDDTTGTFLTYEPQLAFPGYTLEDVLQHDFFGRLAGANYSTYKAYEGGLQIGRYVESWTNEQGNLEKVLFTVNGRKSSTYTKVVTVLLTQDADGVYAVVPENGACNGKVAESTKFAEFNTDGTVKYLQDSGKDLATSDSADGYGCRGLTLTRYIPSDKAVLAFKGVTVDEIRRCSFSGYSTGRSFANGYTSVGMTGYNTTVTEEDAGIATKLRVEMQVIDDGHNKCVIVEFTNGADGVYVKAIKARYKTGAALGYKFVNDDGSYNGKSQTLARDYSVAGYGVCAIKVYAPPSKEAVWTGAAGDGDPTNVANWEGGELPDGETLVKMGGEVYLNAVEGKTFVCKSIVFTNDVTLTGTCDWSAMPVAPDTKEFVLDLDGNGLVLSDVVVSGTVTNSTDDVDNPGTLTFVVAEGVTLENATLAMTGNLKLIKDGAGMLVMAKNAEIAQAEIMAGTFKLNKSRGLLGAGTVTIDGGATFDSNGCYDTAYGLVMKNGATLTNSGTGCDYKKRQFDKGITLETDAMVTVDAANQMSFTAASYGAYPIDLNGGTLVKCGSAVLNFTNTHITNGTIRVESGEIYLNAGNKGFSASDDVVFEASGEGIFSPSSSATIPTLAGNGHVNGTAALTVTKSLGGKVVLDSAVTLADGATLDLNGNDEPYETYANFTFGEGNITIDISGREIEENEQIVAWDAKPEGVWFRCDDATAQQGWILSVRNDGIFVRSGETIATAYWTNKLGDGDITNPENWACTNSTGEVVEEGVPNETTTVYFTGDDIKVQIGDVVNWAAVSVNGKLGEECDWSGLKQTTIVEGSAIDLNGYGLTLTKVFEGTITNSTGDVATLTFNVVEGEMVQNMSMSIQGNIQFVKEGAGTFDGRLAKQLFTGGTVVKEGVITSNESETNHHWGSLGSTVTIEPNGVLDVKNNLSWCHHKIILNGGVISNATDNTSSTAQGIGDIELLADSKVIAKYHTMFSDNRGEGYVGVINLGGHTLEFVQIPNPKDDKAIMYFNNTVVSNGTLAIGRKIKFNPRKAMCMGENVTLDMQGDFFLSSSDCTVTDFIDGSKGDTQSLENDRRVYVTGRYTPQSDCLVNVGLKNGSTLDLTAETDAWTFTNRLAKQTMTFEDGATIAVNVSGRTLEEGDKIIAWDARPSATFAFAGYQGGLLAFPELDGLYARSTSREVDKGYWTGAAGDGDPLNPANWACTNSAGQVVTEAIPTNAASSIVIRNLTTDLDWTKLGAFAFAEGSLVDLNGHNLVVSDFANRTTGVVITNTVETTGDFVVNVAEDVTAQNTTMAISGNVRLVKEGAGTFVPSVKAQTYTGGTVVNAGIIKASSAENDGANGNRLGANDTEIRVNAGGTFDINGKFKWANHDFVLNGGILANYGAFMNGYSRTNGNGIHDIRLEDDSFVEVAYGTTFGHDDAVIELNGHTLSVTRVGTQADYACLYVRSTIQNGTFRIGSTVQLFTIYGNVCGENLTIESYGDFRRDNISQTLMNLVDASENLHAAAGSGVFTVTKSFTPVTQNFQNTKLADGATIDLSGKTEPWSTASAIANQTVTFAENATITVDLTGRTVNPGDKIIAWTAQPPATAKILSKGADVYFVRKDDGLYAARASMIFVR